VQMRVCTFNFQFNVLYHASYDAWPSAASTPPPICIEAFSNLSVHLPFTTIPTMLMSRPKSLPKSPPMKPVGLEQDQQTHHLRLTLEITDHPRYLGLSRHGT